MDKKISIVIPVHNALPYLKNTVEALLNSNITDGQYPIIVVNDFSDIPTSSFIERLDLDYDFPRGIYTLYNSKQQLFTRTINKGIRFAADKHGLNSDIVITMNSDCRLQPHWDTEIIELLENDSFIGLAGYRDSTPPNIKEVELYENVVKPGYVTGHLCALRVSALEETGVYCESDTTGVHFPELAGLKGLAHIGSDRLLSYRMNECGYKTVYCNYPGVEHEAGKSWGHNLAWLASFNLEPLDEAKDTL